MRSGPDPYRVRDIVVASAGLVALAPVMAACAVAVRIVLGSPVLFRQARPGLHGKPFAIVKFRTMTSVKAGGVLLSDEQRMTPLGRFLRATSLDELPSLVNVARGEMSLVGPRPLLMSYLDRYSPEQARRHDVRPGLTGWAQINGRNDLPWDQKLALDLWYVEHRSMLLDAKILVRTVSLVMRQVGISAKGHATAPEFQGGGVTSEP